jgi:hypothetical protein
MLNAYFDDSGSDPNSIAFILAGFVAPNDKWNKFQIAWDLALHEPPGIKYFKSNEAYGLKGEFHRDRGWTEQKRNNKVIDLTRVIVSHGPRRFSVAVYHHDYKTYMTEIPAKYRFTQLRTPYFMLFYQAFVIVAAYHSARSAARYVKPEPCDFFFDEQGKIGKEARDWWERFKAAFHKNPVLDLTPYWGADPTFVSDADAVPLQAADLYAGQLNRFYRSRSILSPMTPPLQLLWTLSGIHDFFDADRLRETRRSFDETARDIEMREPGSLKRVAGYIPKKRGPLRKR